MRCPNCRVDVHACKQCRFYDIRYIGGCSHDQADKVLDKQTANYCTHFRPSMTAYRAGSQEPQDRPHEALAELFGEQPRNANEASTVGPETASTEQARRAAEALFSSKPEPGKDP